MRSAINWLHLTDLHVGVRDGSWLWPTIKHEFFSDLDLLQRELGGLDLVLFTGDLTQSGTKREFADLEVELTEVWEHLAKGGRAPLLCVVPGNHDLVRLAGDSAISKVLRKDWWTDSALRDAFWRKPQTEYRSAVDQTFSNFLEWRETTKIPLCKPQAGLLPGDFSATFEKGGARLGIIGLNSAFLQVAGGDFEGKLDLHAVQLHAVCDGDATKWIRDRTGTVLLTHHPTTWLAPEAREHFRQEIYPPGRFLSHFCGHQHEPAMLDTAEAGAAPRRVRQGASLLGLENWTDNDIEKRKRIHGYSAGQYGFDASSIIEKIWPRVTVKGRHGGLNLRPDHSYSLNGDNCVVTVLEAEGEFGEMPPLPRSPPQPHASEDVPILAGPPSYESAKQRLGLLPRLPVRGVGQQHRVVRQSEQSELELELRRSKTVWVNADWGMGVTEFVATGLVRFTNSEPLEVFHLQCEDALDVESLEACFTRQFAISLQSFCWLVSAVPNCFLVMEDVQPQIAEGGVVIAARRMIDAMTEFSVNLRVIATSRARPHSSEFPVVTLKALDVPDVRSYLAQHADASPDLHEPEVVEKIHDRSDGLPKHIDHLLKALQVSSLTAVLDGAASRDESTAPQLDHASKALARTISALDQSLDKRSKRSFRLLKVLSILSYGETIETLKHYLPTEPFFEENALQLRELGLLDVVLLKQTSTREVVGIAAPISSGTNDAPKILRVPRQVRDYVRALIGESELTEITQAGINSFFGRRWREGVFKLRKIPIEHRDYLSSGAGNEFALLKTLVGQPKVSASDELARQKFALLCIQYGRHLESASRFRDAAVVAGSLLQLIDQDEHPKEWCDLARIYVIGQRMTGHADDAIKYARAILETDGVLSKEELATIWMQLAFAYEHTNKTEALAAAKKVGEFASPGSGPDLQARTLIAKNTNAAKRSKELIAIEKEARSSGMSIAANNIALILADDSDSTASKFRHIDRVLVTPDDQYNHVRAIVLKAELLIADGERDKLKSTELLLLASAYSYLHAQRFGSLFDRCHDALWNIFENDNTADRLLLLFRHTSFLWRIRGNEAKETSYLKRLRERVAVPESSHRGALAEIRYFFLRVRTLLSNNN